jgi:hypothetical protein
MAYDYSPASTPVTVDVPTISEWKGYSTSSAFMKSHVNALDLPSHLRTKRFFVRNGPNPDNTSLNDYDPAVYYLLTEANGLGAVTIGWLTVSYVVDLFIPQPSTYVSSQSKLLVYADVIPSGSSAEISTFESYLVSTSYDATHNVNVINFNQRFYGYVTFSKLIVDTGEGITSVSPYAVTITDVPGTTAASTSVLVVTGITPTFTPSVANWTQSFLIRAAPGATLTYVGSWATPNAVDLNASVLIQPGSLG